MSTGDGPGIDLTSPSAARVWDFLLGGPDNFPSDRALAELVLGGFPFAGQAVLENRTFLERAVGFLAGQAGVGQFLDLGVGLPPPGALPSVHQMARRARPGAVTVAVDNDLLVSPYFNAVSAAEDCGGVPVDLRNLDAVLGHPAMNLIKFADPVTVVMSSVLAYFTDDDAHRLLTCLAEVLAPGSYLVISHVSATGTPADDVDRVQAAYAAAGIPLVFRSDQEITAFFAGCELLDPGTVPVHQWRPEGDPVGDTGDLRVVAGVGRLR